MASGMFGHSSYKEISLLLSECLDDMGYSSERIQRRRIMNQSLYEIYNGKGFSANCITSGAKGEGNGLYFESDIDRLFVFKGVECMAPDQMSSAPVVFHLDTSRSSPGYARLKLLTPNRSDCIHEVRKFLIEQNDGIYISNSFTLYEQQDYVLDIHGHFVFKERTKCGPATAYGNKNVKYDIVPGFICICTELLKKWIDRPRQYDWPPKDVVEIISKSEVHVVPVANKSSEFPDSEWRISFTKAELCLVHSFSEAQSKLYLLLKFVVKTTLKPICENISTYILKNVIFWVFEENPSDCFSLEKLFDKFFESLQRLKHHFNSGELRCYMIPERNLLAGRITLEERDRVTKQIDMMVNDLDHMFSSCPKIWNALTRKKTNPDEIKAEKIKREKIEDLLYRKNVIFKNAEFLSDKTESGTLWKFEPNLEDNEEYTAINREVQETVIPNEKEREELGSDLETEVITRISKILS